jgi:hypothetical protein
MVAYYKFIDPVDNFSYLTNIPPGENPEQVFTFYKMRCGTLSKHKISMYQQRVKYILSQTHWKCSKSGEYLQKFEK